MKNLTDVNNSNLKTNFPNTLSQFLTSSLISHNPVHSYQQNNQIKQYNNSKSLIKIQSSLHRSSKMKAKKLSQRVISIQAASDYQHKLIDSIYTIMNLKRKAQYDYKNNLQIVNKQIEKYLLAQHGFLTQIVKAFQSYISILYQNQTTLIQGYDNQILSFLAKAKQSNFQQEILKKVQFVDNKVEGCKQQIKHYKKLIRQNQADLQMISSQVVFKSRIDQLSPQQKQKMSQKYTDIQNLKTINEQTLQQHVDGMMNLTMLYNQTIQQLNQYQTKYLQQKSNKVYDNFMRTFVLQVSFIRNIQFDITKILQDINSFKQSNKQIIFLNIKQKMYKDQTIKQSLWGTYKKWINSDHDIDINQHFIPQKIKDKWKRVCQYYNEVQI